LETKPNLIQTGAKLANITQALAYKGIRKFEREKKQKTYVEKSTMKRLDMTRHGIKETKNETPTDKTIWESLRNRDISKKIRAFMWTAMHDGHRIGEYWDNKRNYEHRGKCRPCDTTETLEHILTECQCSGQEKAWKLARETIQKLQPDWHTPTLGQMLGQGYYPINRKRTKKQRATERMITIITTETMHLIWKLRCEWKIKRNEDQTKKHGAKEIENRWKAAIKTRIKLDALHTNRRKYGQKALDLIMVIETWRGVVDDDTTLIGDWAEWGVLVGR
ncbi:hypothetical protein BJ165DRAFT_1328275, partial [Panaeolus papilionaceus]